MQLRTRKLSAVKITNKWTSKKSKNAQSGKENRKVNIKGSLKKSNASKRLSIEPSPALAIKGKSNLIGREKEAQSIRAFLDECIANRKGSSLYICGAPGTGKSMSITTVVEEYRKSKSFDRISHVNGLSFSTPSNLFSSLLTEFNPKEKVSKKICERALTKHFLTKRSLSLLILDEMDGFLEPSAQNTLYSLFELAKHPQSTLVLIGIANTLDLTQRFLPRLEMNDKLPQFLIYATYTVDQLSAILEKHAEQENCVVDPSAIKLASMKIASSSGDARKLLELFRSTLNKTEHSISMKDVSNTCSTMLQSPLLKSLVRLPSHQQIVLCCFSAILQKQHTEQTTYPDLYHFYIRSARNNALPEVSNYQFAEIISSLCNASLITVKKSSHPNKRKMVLNLDHADIACAFRDIPIVQSILL